MLCEQYGAKLLVDNAHGAYLKFLELECHPIEQGAWMCCDSAHKTLPVLTGGAYLHVNKSCTIDLARVKDAMALFASTSPSYLILQSLDMANKLISDGYGKKLCDFMFRANVLKAEISALGFELMGSEPFKITIPTKKFGYYGYEIADILERNRIHAEFYDNDYLVLMISPKNTERDFDLLTFTLGNVKRRAEITEIAPIITPPEKAVPPREALFGESEIVSTDNALGRIFAGFNVSCPPAVQIVASGEIINQSAIDCFKYYGVSECRVLKK